MLSLFGTAVGAGILFLPIRAGMGGFWPVVVMTLLIFPMVWLSHRALSRFVNETSSVDHDITHAAEEYWGRNTSFLITILYFFAIYPICLAYGVGITNTFASFFVNQLQLTNLYDSQTMQLYPSVRLILAIILASAMMVIMLLKEKTITKACNFLVYPLCLVLFAFSFYLIPHWKLEIIQTTPSLKDFIEIVWLTLPVLVFSFNHSPAISTFTLSVRREYGENSEQKANQILFRTSAMLLIFVMFFVFSCILCLDATDFQAARDANIPILSYFANKLDVPFIAYGAPVVAFLAIVTSFFGHYFGAYEGLNGILRKAIKMSGNENPNLKAIKIFSTLFMYVTIIAVAYLNPSILNFIESLGGPIIAMILFMMPMIAIWSVSKLKKYKNPALDLFVTITGILTISSVVYTLF
ncbi:MULTISPECIES: aromatic amino acid transport family protein [Helicobacter]|uniref:aromatic amino acid transport family protein n=1 Tax=Helicobacter TaxID=209 RepID=UPI000DCCC038|nr:MULTISPECIES: aromatic amino acid transport family protein [Helicobacter]MCL9823310.1 HAAAP family serine/threonine permease [Helicobacter colisuis]MDY4426097.1 aromatic amino acid transport family protein [Helicobacter sp.]RAX52214.1 HAAAP family serine/threonine permease [Helicobacter sp. 11-8110]